MWRNLAAILVLLTVPLLPWHRARTGWTALLRCLRHPPEPPPGRPLEDIARDARRLSAWFRSQPRGQSFAKYEARRRAYEDVLAEGCRALGVTHLLGVLQPGTELDAERARVEWALECRGLELGLPL